MANAFTEARKRQLARLGGAKPPGPLEDQADRQPQ
jgi:hypothetical protein